MTRNQIQHFLMSSRHNDEKHFNDYRHLNINRIFLIHIIFRGLPSVKTQQESELVSGFMTEHAAVVFVFFFLAEYGSIVLMCILTSILFIGGYLFIDYSYIFTFIDLLFSYFFFMDWIISIEYYVENILSNSIVEGLLYGLSLGLKSSIMIFVFIWARASFPRIRFDQLMGFCWTVLLPIVFALIILIPCILYSYNILPVNINLF